jgi:hypothetical protein
VKSSASLIFVVTGHDEVALGSAVLFSFDSQCLSSYPRVKGNGLFVINSEKRHGFGNAHGNGPIALQQAKRAEKDSVADNNKMATRIVS